MLYILLLINQYCQQASWSPDLAIDSGYTSYPNQHNIVCDNNNNVHITWFIPAQVIPTMIPERIKYRCYTNNMWVANTLVYWGSWAGYSSIATNRNGNYIYVCWQCNWFSDIWLKRFHDGEWEDTIIEVSSNAEYSYAPSMVCDINGILHIVWEKDYEIHYRKFNGVTFSSDIKLSSGNVYAAYPAIADFDNNLFVAWEDMRDGNFEIYLREYTAQTWQKEVRVTNSSESSVFPSICVDSTGKAHIVWQEEQTGGYKIFYTTYSNNTLGNIVQCVDSPGDAITPSITSKRTKCWLVWSDSRDGYWEIYYKELNAGSWGPDTRLTYANGSSNNPDIAVDNNENLYVLFWDKRDDTAKVYFKENITKAKSLVSITGLTVTPNPFCDKITIRYLPVTGKNYTNNEALATIYDLSGRLVKSLPVSSSQITWDSKDISGKEVQAGIYFLRLQNEKPLKLVKLR